MGGAWLVLTPPSGPRALYLAWLVLCAAVGAGLPGLANQVSLARAYLALPALGYALDPTRLGALAATVVLAGLSDLADGSIARRFERPTRLGAALDPVVDGVFFGAVAVGLAAGGAYPDWLAAVIIARYALPALAGGVLLAAGRAPELRHTVAGQLSTTLIAVLLGWLVLWRGLGLAAGFILLAAEVTIPVATAATFVNLAWANRRAILSLRA